MADDLDLVFFSAVATSNRCLLFDGPAADGSVTISERIGFWRYVEFVRNGGVGEKAGDEAVEP